MFFMNAVSDILFFFAVLFIFVVGLVVLAAVVATVRKRLITTPW